MKKYIQNFRRRLARLIDVPRRAEGIDIEPDPVKVSHLKLCFRECQFTDISLDRLKEDKKREFINHLIIHMQQDAALKLIKSKGPRGIVWSYEIKYASIIDLDKK